MKMQDYIDSLINYITLNKKKYYYDICFQYPNKNIFKYKVNLPFRWQYKKTKNKTILRCQRINEKIFKEALRKLDYTYKLSDDGIILTLNSLHNEGGLIWK
jgi:hypothetical protein